MADVDTITTNVMSTTIAKERYFNKLMILSWLKKTYFAAQTQVQPPQKTMGTFYKVDGPDHTCSSPQHAASSSSSSFDEKKSRGFDSRVRHTVVSMID
jgi:hypothetical protein